MAKKKKAHKPRKSPRRSNPKNKPPRRRRRNPGTFAERAGKLAAGAAVAVATAVGTTFATAKIMPGSKVALYGIPGLIFLAGVGIARTMPTLGVGMALGSFAPFALPLSTQLLAAASPSATPASTPAATAAGISRAYRNMRAVSMSGDGRGWGMRAVDLGAVDMGRAYR